MKKLFMLKPVCVEAMQVDIDNLEELADWCDGIVTFSQLDEALRQVQTNRESGYNRADVGDWIIKHSRTRFTIQTNEDIYRKYLEMKHG